MTVMIDKIRWIVVGLCLMLAAGLAALTLMGTADALDVWAYDNLIRFASDSLTTYFKFITFWADSPTMIAFAIVAVLWALAARRQIGFYLAGTLAISTLLNVGLKLLVARPRPEDIALIVESGHSFPSGHAMAAASFYGFLICVIVGSGLKQWAKWVLSGLLTFLIINICLSRVYLGVHFASDVVAGALLSICLVLIASYIAKRKGVL